MPTRRGILFTITTAVITIVALAVAGFVAKDRMREEWYIWGLRSAEEETRLHAAEQLGEMKSVRAVPELIRCVRDEPREYAELFPEHWSLTPFIHALYRIGDEAIPDLFKATTFEDMRLAHLLMSADDAIRDVGRRVEMAPYNDQEAHRIYKRRSGLSVNRSRSIRRR